MAKPTTFYTNLFNGINQRTKKLFIVRYSKINVNWFLLKYLKHLPPDKVHSHKLLNHETFFYGGPEYLHGLFEIFIGDIYNQKLPQNAYVLDCGGHIGLSVIYIKAICPSAQITVFEPDAQNYTLLRKNIASHQLEGIDARQEAVWIENTQLSFIQEGNMGSKIGTDSTTNTTKVTAVRLKDFLNKKVDFLKLDIEGAEYKVLKDISENLSQVSNMFIEYHGSFAENPELVEIFNIIVTAGFKFYIKEAAINYEQPFLPPKTKLNYDVQLNIFCFKKS
jgi:FkbM family methyltransferase